MNWLFRLIRSSIFVGSLAIFLLGAAVTSTLWALQLSSTVATMSANAVATAARHRKEIARAVARTKAKARLRRFVVAIPVLGAGAIIVFEEQDYQEWLEENPEGTRGVYSCEVAHFSAEVIDEVLAGLPEYLRPGPDTVLAWMPECDDPDLSNRIIESD